LVYESLIVSWNSMPSSSRNSPPTGINVTGHITANPGLGVLARALVRLLAQKGAPVAALDIDAGHGRSGADLSLGETSSLR